MNTNNRTELRIVELALNNPGIKSLSFEETLKVMGFDLIFPLLPFIILGGGAGYTAGWILADMFKRYSIQMEIAVLCGCLLAFLAAWVKFDVLIAANQGYYAASFDGREEETAGDVFLPVTHTPGQTITIRATQKQLDNLATLAGRYPSVKNMAYEDWTPARVCFSRPQFLEVRQILEQLRLADRLPDDQLVVNRQGEAAFGRWRVGDFEEFDAPPPPESGGGYA